MSHFVEIILELLFSSSEADEMPDIEFADNFTVKPPVQKTIIKIIVWAVLVIVFSLLWIFVGEDGFQYLYATFVISCAFLFIHDLVFLSFRCFVNEKQLIRSYLGVFKKEIRWGSITCIRTIMQSGKKEVIIALYNRERKLVLDVSTDMENAWYIVKMAEHKGIEIRAELDLTIRQIYKL